MYSRYITPARNGGFFIALCKYRVFSIIFCIFLRNLQKISVNAFIEKFYEDGLTVKSIAAANMDKVPKNIFITIKLTVGLLVASLIFGFAVQTSRDMPPNAILYVSDHKKIYLAPPCLESCASYRLTTAKEVRELGYSPDKDCRDRVGFHQPDRSFTGHLFQRIGLLKPLPSRWNENGTWNY